VVECVTIRRDMMQVQIPGTGIKSWIPTDVLELDTYGRANFV